ncbi:MAG: ACT domain-containing protein [Eubacterium sp.]|nr:ACT domain-containing protein [Eubacterium sp.]
MSKIKYYLVNADILPEVYSRVIKAKGYLASGEAGSTSQAVKMAGISRSAYYKYKDAIFEYNGESEETATINAMLMDNAGVLSSLMNEVYKAGANVLSVNQSVPVNSVASVSLTVRVMDMSIQLEELVGNIKKINGVNSVSIGG